MWHKYAVKMSHENPSGDSRIDEAQSDELGNLHVVFINGVKHELDRDQEYTAADLIDRAGDDSSDHTLVATKGESGKDVKVFNDDDETIDFNEQHRKHFETKADGDTYI